MAKKPDNPYVVQPVMKALKAQLNNVTEVRISKGDGSKSTLRKQPTGWIVGEREYPADTTKVRKLLIDLSSLNTVEAKTSDPEKYSLLGVEDVNTSTATGTRVEAVTGQQVHGVLDRRRQPAAWFADTARLQLDVDAVTQRHALVLGRAVRPDDQRVRQLPDPRRNV